MHAGASLPVFLKTEEGITRQLQLEPSISEDQLKQLLVKLLAIMFEVEVRLLFLPSVLFYSSCLPSHIHFTTHLFDHLPHDEIASIYQIITHRNTQNQCVKVSCSYSQVKVT